MATQKTLGQVLIASVSVAATASVNSGWINWTVKQGMTTYIRVTNGATAPTVRPVVKVERADTLAGANPREVINIETPLGNNVVTDIVHVHAVSDGYIRVTVDNSGEAVQAITAHVIADTVDNIA